LRRLSRWAADWQPVISPPPPDSKLFPKNPTDLPSDSDLQIAGDVEMVPLVPYGATHLRLTTIPVIPARPAAGV
jgi:hypothetical protein